MNGLDPTIRKEFGDDFPVNHAESVKNHIAAVAEQNVTGSFVRMKLTDCVSRKVKTQTVIAIPVDLTNGKNLFVRRKDVLNFARERPRGNQRIKLGEHANSRDFNHYSSDYCGDREGKPGFSHQTDKFDGDACAHADEKGGKREMIDATLIEGPVRRKAMKTYRALRAWNLAFVRSLTEKQKAQVVTHPERGTMTVWTIVETMAGHDLHHLERLEKLPG